MNLSPEQERLFIADLERRGVSQVRHDLDHGAISSAFVYLTSQWLSGKEREEERRKEASISAQIEEMRRASVAAERQATAAERANMRATIALIIAIASMIITIVGIAVTHWDVRK